MISQSANRMDNRMHHFGAASIQVSTTPVRSPQHRNGAVTNYMKGKYPNGLAAAIKARDLTPRRLAEVAGTSRQQVEKLVSGERELTAIWAERLAPALKVSPEELVFPSLKRSRVPLLSWVSAGKLGHEDGVRKSDIRKYTFAADLPKGDWIALEVKGDSMDRVAPDGATIFVNRADDKLVDNAFYVFSTPAGEVTFKRYRAGARPRLQPFSTNPDHETIHVTEEMHVIGRVGRVITDLM